MDPSWLYYLWALLLIVVMAICWCTTLFALPGNWLILGAAILFCIYAGADTRGLAWASIYVAGGLALIGEVVEAFAGAAGAKKAGASRRSIVLAVVGTMIGGIAGTVIGVPFIPLFGPLIGAVGGGTAGAFAGAYFGEQWKGRDANQSMAAAKGAMIGRLLGTGGKLLAGALMIVVIGIDALL